MKIYTKTGDTGSTSLFGGTRVSKHHIRIESYGTIDELNAHIGLLNDLCSNQKHKAFLLKIQHELFVLGAMLATEKKKEEKLRIQTISMDSVMDLENEIDSLNDNLPQMTHFILPGGHPTISNCHICRCICRRAERLIVHLNEIDPIDEICIQYVNRLSDYLFVLGRKIAFENNIEEVKWIPEKIK